MTRTQSGAGGEVRLELLGGVGLSPDGEEGRRVLSQPKRVALLAYVALRRGGDFVRRDELLGLFWGESDEGRARAALRQALRFLRRKLGSEVVVNRGDGEVALGSAGCDALDLFQAMERGDDRRIVELYAGDLMPGFFLDEGHDFDRWLHAERQRLRTAAVAAALRLAEEAEAEGDLDATSGHLRWALRHDRTNEAVARRLIGLLGRSGNRAAAVEVFDALTERLATELGLEPSDETVRVYTAVRDGEGLEELGRSPVSAGDRSRSPRRILVVDLENLTGDADLGWIGRLAAERVAQGLSTLEDLEVVPPLAVGPVDATDADVDVSALPPALGALAARTRAGTVVGGSYHLEDGDLRFQVRVTDVAAGTLRPGPDPVGASRSAPVDGIERLREAVMTSLGPRLSKRSVHVREATRPPGMAAYRSYLDGLDLFIQGEWRGALEHFRRATQRSPDYALPRIVGGIALWNLSELAEAHAVAEEAHALRGSLGRFERAVLDNLRAWLAGDWAAAHRAARAQAELAPGSIPHFQVAEEARRLNRPREAREVLAELDPDRGEMRGWIYYWLELATAHHLLGDHTRELETAARARQAHPDDPMAVLLEARALAGLGRVDDVLRLSDQALASPPVRRPWPGELVLEAALELRAHGHADAAQPLLESAVDWCREHGDVEGADGLRARRELGRALYHAGELDEARTVFTELVRASDDTVQPVGYHHGHLQGHLDQGHLAVIALRTGDAEAAARWRTWLEDLDEPFVYGANWLWLAAADALVGAEERAVRRLRRAFADGLPMELFVHLDPHLQRLEGHDRLEGLVRPRG